jgi:hypothetical protein
MKSIRKKHVFLAFGLFLLLPTVVAAQQRCEPWYSIPHFGLMGTTVDQASNENYSLALSVGQATVQPTATNRKTHSAAMGFWSYNLEEPRPPLASASDGDFDDRVLVTWDIENDSTAAPVTADKATLYRNGYVLTTLPINQRQYQDFNVFAGEVYEYAVTVANSFGESHQKLDVGFLNPNGMVIGTVETPNGNPVLDVKVVLTPNLGRSAFFDDSAYIYFPSLVDGLKTSDYTVEGWFRASPVVGTPTPQTLFAAVDSGTVNQFVRIELTAEGKLQWQHSAVAGQAGATVMSPVEYVEERDWHHFAVVYDADVAGSTMTLYVDGNVAAAGVGVGLLPKEMQVVLGKLGPQQDEGYFGGRLDDIRLWNLARTRAEIRQDMDRTLSGDEAGLHAYWKFDEQQGEKIFDLTANDNDGALCRVERSDFIAPVFLSALTDETGHYSIKGIYYGSGTEFTVTPQKETPIGRSLQFDGVDDYVDFPNDRLDLRAGYTVEGWFKSAGTATHTLFAAVQPTSGATHLRVELADGKLKCAHGSVELVSAESYNHDYWHHFAVSHVAGNGALTFYVDGEQVGSASSVAPVAELSALVLGRQSPLVGARQYAGLLDEIRVWNYGRTAEMVGGTKGQTLVGDEAGLAAYWRLNEGDGDLATDDTGEGHSGMLQGGPAWTDDIPLKEMFVHTFDPESRQVVLNPSNTSVDRVDFTDISQIAVSGFVRYEGTPCFIQGVEMLVNGEQLVPPIFTDENGKFVAEFEPGASGQILSVRFMDHAFAPPFIELPRIIRPLTGIYFDDAEKRNASGKVVGGVGEFPITPSQGRIEVNFTAVDGCIQVTAVPDESTGMFNIANLPPLNYKVTVDHPDPTIDAFFAGEDLSLAQEDGEIDFVYRSAPYVEISGFPVLGCDKRVLAMEESHTVTIDVFEEYINHTPQGEVVNRSASESGTLTITDGIGDKGQAEVEFENGTAAYEITAGYPNIVDGGDHPYQKSIHVTAVDELGQSSAVEEWVYVTGHRPRETAFATTTPDIPLMIIRAPPGDGSAAYWSSGKTLSQSIGFGMSQANNTSAFAAVHLGIDFEMSIGFIVMTTLSIDVTMDLSTEMSITRSQNSATEQTWTYTTTETITTTDGGDVYIGGAMNILYGITDVLEIDPTTCEVRKYPDLILVPNGFKTHYVYSESHILDTLIPNLYTIGEDESAERWQSFVDNNNQQKENAIFSRNISFDAGAIYEFEESTEVSQTQTVDFEVELQSSVAFEAGIAVNGLGFTAGVSTQMTTGSSQSQSATQAETNTIGFVLTDDDMGDNFTIDVKHEPVYGTPVFETVSGFSQCPWEPNTVPFDGAQLAVSPAREVDVMPDEVASFELNLGNVSQADADREYHLRVINETNPDGAVIAINGVILEDHLSFFVPAGESVQATMTVARGPNEYEYDGIELQLVPPCEYEKWENGSVLQLADTIAVDVHYKVPCSECSVAVPEANWLVTGEHAGNELSVTLDGYDREDPNLEFVELQYRRGSGDWFVARTIPSGELVDDYVIVPWDISPSIVIDGTYELRGRAVCGGGLVPGTSPVVIGLIDRNPPEILGAAEPADGILHPDDQIAIRFNEVVECGQIDVGAQHIKLTDAVLGEALDFTHTCGGNEVVIEPNLQNAFIENRTLRVEVGPIEDLQGNVQTVPQEWELYVNRNPIEWAGLDIEDVVIYVDKEFSTTRLLKNNGGSSRSYELTDVPAWLEVSPLEGTIAPGAAQTVSFKVDGPAVGAGSYQKTIHASGAMGDEPRKLDVRVLCYPPVWAVDPADFQHSMTITATLSTDHELSDDVYDQVGVFVGDELRGMASVKYIPRFEELADTHPYEVFLTIYSNQLGGEDLSFRVWDASECRELGMVFEDYAFEANVSHGTPTSPVTITATSQIISEISLPAGWTWLSLNLMGEDMSPNAMLGSLEAKTNDMIKGQGPYAQYVPGAGWLGNLKRLQCGSMYMTRLTEVGTLEMIGYAVDVEATEIPVQAGWNWIGYLPQQSMDTERALSSLESVTGDIVKSQFEYSQFVEGIGWVGSLGFMAPKMGYQLYSVRGGELAYPFYEAPAVAKPTAVTAARSILKRNAAGWSLEPTTYPHSMTLTGTVEGDGVTLAEEDLLGAFVEGECRGIAQPIYVPELERSVVFLMIYGEVAADELVRFRLFDADGGGERFVPTEVEFRANEMLGTALEPLRLETRERRLGDPGFVPETYLLGQSYPNPFNPSTRIGYGLPQDGEVEIAIYNLLGQKVVTLLSEKQSTGYWYATWDGRDDSGHAARSGLYFFAMRAGDFRAVRKVLLVK